MAPLVVPAEVLASLLATLTPGERLRADRYRLPHDGRRFAVARGWLRRVLGTATGTAARDLAITAGPGKPRLVDGGPCFNLAHAGDLALIAVAEREVGVDVEHLGSGPAGLDAVAVACTAAEVAVLRRLPPAVRPDAFLAIWTAKEAYLKARGVGLAEAPDCIEVRTTGEAGSTGWWVRRIDPSPGYVGAVAAEGSDWVVEVVDIPMAVPA